MRTGCCVRAAAVPPSSRGPIPHAPDLDQSGRRKPALFFGHAMKLTTFTDYSLRVLIYLAAQPGRRATISEVASAYGVSENHLVKVVHFLGRQGWLRNVRGKGGGLELGRPAER